MKKLDDRLAIELRNRSRFRRVVYDRPSGWPIILRYLSVFLLIVLIGFAISGYQVATLSWKVPETTRLMRVRQQQARKNGSSFAIRQQWITLPRVGKSVLMTVVAAQDAAFYEHHGPDWKAIGRALAGGTGRGQAQRERSTIPRQLARDFFLSPELSYTGKVRQAVLAAMMETLLTRQRLLELYLNEVELGPGIYGVEQGALYHFGLHANQLTFEQACRLACMIPSPMRYRIYGDYVTAQASRLAARLGNPDAFMDVNPGITVRSTVSDSLNGDPIVVKPSSLDDTSWETVNLSELVSTYLPRL